MQRRLESILFAALFSLPVLLCGSGCTGNPIAGDGPGTTEIGNAKVKGRLVNKSGCAKQDALVRLLPVDFNPAEDTVRWIDTTEIAADSVAASLEGVDGIIVPGGFGVRGTSGKIECIRYVRENRIPYLGICLGFQMAVIEFARNVLGLEGAGSTEITPDCDEPVIDILPEQKRIEGLGGNMRLGGQDIVIEPDTFAAELFEGAEHIRMRFRHRYEVDPRYVDALEAAGMKFSGKHPTHPIMQILELPRDVHPYFVGTQAHPCLTSRPLRPQPMFVGLVKAALQRRSAAGGGA